MSRPRIIAGLADAGSGNDNISNSNLPTTQPVSVPFTFIPPVQAFATCDECTDGLAKGGSGRDGLFVRGGIADGGSGNDDVSGQRPGDDVRGGAGNDTLTSTFAFGPVTLNGGSGFDDCAGADPGDILISCEVV